MKRRYLRYSLPVLLALAGMILLVFTGMERMTPQELTQVRLNQLREIQLNSDQDLEPLLMLGDKAVDDYFHKTTTGYQYLGGIYDASWQVGENYSAEELVSANVLAPKHHTFFHRTLSDRNLYINIDRGDESAVKDFLKAMDQQGLEDLDSLVIDFRFLGHVDFGSVLRLFNQIAPRDRMVLGTSISDHQETVVRSSGQPFFTANHTLFLVDPLMPEAVKRLVINLSDYPGFEVLGSFGYVADTVCLLTDFAVGSEIYRVCTEKWTDDAKNAVPDDISLFLNDTAQIHLLKKADDHWYKNRDSTAMENLIPGILNQLLP